MYKITRREQLDCEVPCNREMSAIELQCLIGAILNNCTYANKNDVVSSSLGNVLTCDELKTARYVIDTMREWIDYDVNKSDYPLHDGNIGTLRLDLE